MSVQLSVVVTIYNAAPSIPELIERLIASSKQITEDFELIFVEDRSRDNSWEVLKKNAIKDARIKACRFARNFGQHNGITAGLHLATGKYIVLMDGDLQDEPEVIEHIYKRLNTSGAEIVYVKRKNRKDGAFKKITSKLYNNLFSSLSGIYNDPEVGTFRIMTKLVRDSFCTFTERNKYIGGIFYWMNFQCDFYEAEHKDRKHGKSNYNLKRMIELASKGIFYFSNKPLQFATYIGFLCSAFSFLFGCYYIYRKIFYHISVTGYASIIVSLYFIGGLILFVLGIMGKYLGYIFDQSKARPEYIIEEKINF